MVRYALVVATKWWSPISSCRFPRRVQPDLISVKGLRLTGAAYSLHTRHTPRISKVPSWPLGAPAVEPAVPRVGQPALHCCALALSLPTLPAFADDFLRASPYIRVQRAAGQGGAQHAPHIGGATLLPGGRGVAWRGRLGLSGR